MYSRLKCSPVQSAALYDFSRRRISIEGYFTAPVIFQGRHAEILFYVVKGSTDILGIDAIEALRLHINGLIYTASSGCLSRAPAAVPWSIEMVSEPTCLYGFGSRSVPVARSLGHFKAKMSINGVVAEKISVLLAQNDAQSIGVLAGTFHRICKGGKRVPFLRPK
ncbi:hypothetical protein MTO96_011450 [Rhipicephalus appendiculatus]